MYVLYGSRRSRMFGVEMAVPLFMGGIMKGC